MRRGERPDETCHSEEVSQESRAATRGCGELGPAGGRPDIFPDPLNAPTGRHLVCRSRSSHDPPSDRDAFAPPEKAADRVFLNGKVITVDPAAAIAQSVAIKDGLIQAVDTDGTIRALDDAVTRTMDLACESVTPGWGSTGAVQRRSAGLVAR